MMFGGERQFTAGKKHTHTHLAAGAFLNEPCIDLTQSMSKAVFGFITNLTHTLDAQTHPLLSALS